MAAVLKDSGFKGVLRSSESMGRHCSLRAGGAADHYFEPAGLDDLADFLSRLPEYAPVLFMGRGSNLLVRDGGWRGWIINTAKMPSDFYWLGDGRIYVEAGISCTRISREAERAGLVGAAFLAGIPGTVGGALAMNAGAFGGEFWDLVESVDTIDRHGERHRRPCHDFEIRYRHVSGLTDEWFVAARLALPDDGLPDDSPRIRVLLAERAERQPLGKATCGSVFRNPPGDYAGRLIDACGLKGYRVGGCHVSTKHANFIINDRRAKAAEIEELILRIQSRVQRETGIRLFPEVHIVGEHPVARVL